MTQKGYRRGMKIFDWVPVLRSETWKLNRADVKLYGFSPFLLVNGFPPEAPDHTPLAPALLRRLHEECAERQVKQAKGIEDKEEWVTYKRGDIVRVYQESRKSKTLVGQLRWPSLAVVQDESTTTKNYYHLRWINDGVVGKDKGGDFSTRLFVSFRLKRCNTKDIANMTHEEKVMKKYIRDEMRIEDMAPKKKDGIDGEDKVSDEQESSYDGEAEESLSDGEFYTDLSDGELPAEMDATATPPNNDPYGIEAIAQRSTISFLAHNLFLLP